MRLAVLTSQILLFILLEPTSSIAQKNLGLGPLKRCFDKYSNLDSYRAKIRQLNYDSSLTNTGTFTTEFAFSGTNYFASNEEFIVIAENGIQLTLQISDKQAILSKYDQDEKINNSLEFLKLIDTSSGDIKVQKKADGYLYKISTPSISNTLIQVLIDPNANLYKEIEVIQYLSNGSVGSKMKIEFVKQEFDRSKTIDENIDEYITRRNSQAEMKAPYSDFTLLNLLN